MTRTERKAHNARMAELKAKAAAIVATGSCPDCGAGLHRNLSLAGWWACNEGDGFSVLLASVRSESRA